MQNTSVETHRNAVMMPADACAALTDFMTNTIGQCTIVNQINSLSLLSLSLVS